MLRRIKSIGLLFGRDHGKALARAVKARETEGCGAALAVLEEALGRDPDDEELRADADYAAARLLQAECLAEQGLEKGDLKAVVAGVRVLVRADAHYRSCLIGDNGAWPAVLSKAEGFITAALAGSWQPGVDKGLLRPELGQVAGAWNALQRPVDAVRVATAGLKSFPGDPDLRLCLGEAAACQSDLGGCLRHITDALSGGGLPGSPAKVISLLEAVQKSGDRILAGRALAWSGEVYRRLSRWDQAHEVLLQAQAKLGDEIDDLAVEALLVTCARKRSFRELEQYGRHYIERGIASSSLGVIVSAIRELLDNFPERKLLWLIWAEASLVLGRDEDALAGFQRVLVLDRLTAADILSALRTLGDAEVIAAGLRVSLARAFLASGDTALGLDLLGHLGDGKAPAEELAAAVALCAELIEREPANAAAADCLLRLREAQGDWLGAVGTAGHRFAQTGDATTTLEWCARAVEAAAAAGDAAAELAARRLEVEVRQAQGDSRAVLAGLRRLAEHSLATPETLDWVVSRLSGSTGEDEAAWWAGLVRGDIARRRGQPQQAVEEYLGVLAGKPSGECLEAVCAGLGRVWTAAADRARAGAALARGWLMAGRPAEARVPLIACVEGRQGEAMGLLELLRARQAQHPGSDEWVTLGIEAGLAIGVESNLAAVAESLYRLLELRPERASWVEETARQLAQRAAADETREAAVLVQARAGVLCGEVDRVERLCQWLAEECPAWRGTVVDTIEDAAAGLEPSLRGRLCLTVGRMLAQGAGDEGRAARCFEQAAAACPAECGEAAMAEVVRLASRPDADPGLLLANARTALRLGRGESACGEVLRLLERVEAARVPEARELARAVLADLPESGRAWLLLARCEARLGQAAGAVAAYRRVVQSGEPGLHDLALGDLEALRRERAEDFEVFAAWLDALEARGARAEVLEALVERVVRLPAQAGECLGRLRGLFEVRPGAVEEGVALAEALRLAGRPSEAVAVWSGVLRADVVDWERAAVALRLLVVKLPRDFAAAVLLLRAELRSVVPELLAEPLRRMERVMALPGREEAWLAWLLEDCGQARHRGAGREEVVRLARQRRAELLALLGNASEAAAELEGLVRECPSEVRTVAAFCQRELDAGREPVYWRPLARARFAAGEVAGGVAALRRWIEALPAEVAEAQALCEEYAGQTPVREMEAVQLPAADLAARGGDAASAARGYLALARRVPTATAEVSARLAALAESGVPVPEVYTAQAEIEYGGRPERLGAAFAILRRFVEREPGWRAAAVLPLVRGWREAHPRNVEPRVQALWLMFRVRPLAVAEVEAEVRSLLAECGVDGARAWVDFCGGELAEEGGQVAFWHLRGEAHRMLGDVVGAVACLRTLLRIDFPGEWAEVERQALALRRGAVWPPGVLELLADVAREARDWRKAAVYAAEAVEQPGADLAAVGAGVRTLLEEDPANGLGWCVRARCAWRAGEGAEAAAHFRRALGLAGTPDLGERLEALCEAFPDVALCWLVRGERAFGQGRREEALPVLERASGTAGLEPVDQVALLRMLCECHVAARRYDDAVGCLRRLIQVAPGDDQAARRLMELHFERTDHELAQVRAAVGVEGETPELAHRMGSLLSARGDYDEAARWFRRVPREHALANRALIESGRCRLALNQGHLATAAFKAVLGNHPSQEDRCLALYQLGVACSRLLDFERAAQAFEDLCMVDPDYEDAARQLQVCQEQLSTGERMRLAEVPFDLLTAWREATARPGPASGTAAGPGGAAAIPVPPAKSAGGPNPSGPRE